MRAVAHGKVGSAVVSEAGSHTRMYGLGDRPSRHILLVNRTLPFDAETARLCGHAAVVLELLLRVAEADASRREGEANSGQLRLAVLQLLMGGEVILAQRTMAAAAPGVLDAEWAHVCVLEVPMDAREGVARECGDRVGDRVLVVPCPAFDNHVIVVVPVTDGATADGVISALSAYVVSHPDVYMGLSRRHALTHVALAYEDAARNLAAARHLPSRLAGNLVRTDLVDVLPAEAGMWASQVLRPLDAVPPGSRSQLLTTMSLALRFTAVRTAKLIGVSRNTVRSRMERAAGLLGVELADVRTRTSLYVALYLRDQLPSSDAGTAGLCLRPLLETGPGRAWARH
ncbi:helix-turn-helix domain-containing protein, partial [Streptomyces sp. NPDC049577]|uniref:PucR family transcriptional regulator n=1 Tax=Streptomyces sp. NPDC049577 TaxID=3155153 RepID=UPI003425B380